VNLYYMLSHCWVSNIFVPYAKVSCAYHYSLCLQFQVSVRKQEECVFFPDQSFGQTSKVQPMHDIVLWCGVSCFRPEVRILASKLFVFFFLISLVISSLRDVHNVNAKWFIVSIRLSFRPHFQLENRWMDFDSIWCGRYAIGCHLNLVLFNFL
jgi:hypothetical protein